MPEYSQGDALNAIANGIKLAPDARPGYMHHVRFTMGTAGTVANIPLPAGSRGFRIKPTGNNLRFCVNETPEALGTSSTDPMPVGAWNRGAWADKDVWEVRLVDSEVANELQLVSETATLVVDLEVF
jgi:hypothetical protein